MTFLLVIFFARNHQSAQIHIHSYRDLNSVSLSTVKLKRLGLITSSWCIMMIPAPHMHLQHAAASSSGGNTSLSEDFCFGTSNLKKC